MGGGKDSGSGTDIPQFVKEAQAQLGERSQRLFDIARPSLETGTAQLADLIRTGGPGANVPIITNAVAAQNAATTRALDTSLQPLERSGIAGTPFGERTTERIARAGTAAADRIPVRAAAPLQQAAISSAFSAGRLGQQGFSAGLRALGAGTQPIRRSAAAQGAGSSVANALLFFGPQIRGLFGRGGAGALGGGAGFGPSNVTSGPITGAGNIFGNLPSAPVGAGSSLFFGGR